MEERENPIELKSEPMNEMLSNPPGWVTRSGNGLFLLVLCMFIGFAWFIRYPDEVNGDVIVTASKAPIELSNQGYVQLKSLHVLENQEVKEGELLAQFDTPAKLTDIEKARVYLSRLEALDQTFGKQIPVYAEFLQLGSFQEQWTLLVSKISEWNAEHEEDNWNKELASIQREIRFREQLQHISNKRIKLSESEYEAIKEQLESSERLAAQSAISKQTLSQDKRTEIQASQLIQNQKEQQVQNLIVLNGLRKEYRKLEYAERMNALQKAADIQLAITTLRTSFQTWEKSAVWQAPCSGKVIFNKGLQVHRFYKTNEASLVIVPKGSGYHAVATIESAGAGKVKTGQKAMIELVDFPKTEFGMLEGKVSSMTQIEKEGKYEIRISLPAKLKTTYNKQIPPKAQLKGKVKIITKDKRLLMRFFEQFTDLIK